MNSAVASSLFAASIATTTFLMKVRIIVRRLALCLRLFSDNKARFLADLILAKTLTPKFCITRDNQRSWNMPCNTYIVKWFLINQLKNWYEPGGWLNLRAFYTQPMADANAECNVS